jgi:FlaA1/EpsC-like NDP-sugar epimerase
MQRYRQFLRFLTRYHRIVEAGVQMGVFPAAMALAFLLRFDLSIPQENVIHLRDGIVAMGLGKMIVFTALGLHRCWWRYLSSYDVLRLAVAHAEGTALGAVGILAWGHAGFPRSILILDCLLGLGLNLTVRWMARLGSDLIHERAERRCDGKALIYGAGDAGVLLSREIRNDDAAPCTVVGFVDDDPRKRNAIIDGIRVLGGGENLGRIVEKHGATMVLIAIPSATGTEMTGILNRCHQAGVEFKTMPGMDELIETHPLLSQVRDIAVEDLLGRQPVRLEMDRIRQNLAGRVVLITGAAGSIGSELCRQVARFEPARLIGFDSAETPMFYLQNELRERFPGLPFQAEIGNIQNPRRLREVFAAHLPSVVFHAAAYKHVPMMEANVFEAVENNVFGTRFLVECAEEYEAEEFIMISSDKAVRPTNVMGATKRLAELVVRAMQNGRTRFVSVRFGNVLGSNGSVVPIFQRQIRNGGPVTVTDPGVMRYFMTIPEATQLVLQASTQGRGGEIFVLDMGEPVKIADLARNLILLSGLRPDVDIEVKFTGLRPGEKLYEELHLQGEAMKPTDHEKIMVFSGHTLDRAQVDELLLELQDICEVRDLGRLTLAFKSVAPDYNPGADLLRRALAHRGPPRKQAASAGAGNGHHWQTRGNGGGAGLGSNAG